MAEAFEDLLVEGPVDGVLALRLNRPEARNALRTQTLREVASALSRAECDDSVRCVLLTGGPEAFAAGADVREMAEKTAVEVIADERARHWQAIREFPKPLVAAVSGYCLGGGNELAMLCDVIVAGEGARFGQPEIKLGLIPGAGGTQRLTAALGKARALRYLLTGDLISGREAYELGLVSEVVADEAVMRRAEELSRAIAEKAPLAVRLLKEAVRQAAEGPLAAGLALERKAFTLLFATEDRREGVQAFLEKRKPEFKGR